MNERTTVDDADLERLHELWHKFIRYGQRNDLGLFSGPLSDLGVLEISIIRHAARSDDLILKDIVTSLRVHPSTLTSAIDRLEKRGYIERQISKRDRRSFRLALTEAGRRADSMHDGEERKLFMTLLSLVDAEEDRKTMLRIMAGMADRYEELVARDAGKDYAGNLY